MTLHWLERFFLAAGCLILAWCALVYLQADLYQRFAKRMFGPAASRQSAARARPAPIAAGTPLSKIEIPRLGVSAVIVEGVSPSELRIAAGHIPGTAFPGQAGNIGIAGHRDTFFRKLRGVRERDNVVLTTARGSFRYIVESTRVVEPSDVQVLRPSGENVLTLVTCYPFSYLGPAPKRFIVRARAQMGGETGR
jgi:sortase A